MRKIINIVFFLVLILIFTSCGKEKTLPEGILYVNENELVYNENLLYDFYHETTFNELVTNSDYVVKFKVLKMNYFSYELNKKNTDNRQIARSYEVKVISVIYGENFTDKRKIVLYSDFWENSTYGRWKQTILEEGNEYIAFLRKTNDLSPGVLKDYIDYYFTSENEGIIICESKSMYLVKPMIAEDIKIKYNEDTAGYPGWSKIISNKFEEFLYDSMMNK